jgi:hypothetical protein
MLLCKLYADCVLAKGNIGPDSVISRTENGAVDSRPATLHSIVGDGLHCPLSVGLGLFAEDEQAQVWPTIAYGAQPFLHLMRRIIL